MKNENVNFLFHANEIDKKALLRRYIEAGLSTPLWFVLASIMGSLDK